MQVTIEQVAMEAVDFPEAKDLVPSHRLAPRIMVACAEIRDLPARGNQSMMCEECESTPACLDSLQHRISTESPGTRLDFFVSRHAQPANVGTAEEHGGKSVSCAPSSRNFVTLRLGLASHTCP
jgi:hypothetical protein